MHDPWCQAPLVVTTLPSSESVDTEHGGATVSAPVDPALRSSVAMLTLRLPAIFYPTARLALLLSRDLSSHIN